MKKILLSILVSLLVASPVIAYTVQNGDTLTKIASKYNTTIQEIVKTNGIKNPNKIFVGDNLNLGSFQEQILGVASLDVIALYEDNLQNSIATTDTSLTLVRGTDKAGTALSGTFGFIIDEGSTIQEFITATCAGTTCTSVSRGISLTDGSTSVTALKKAHRKGATIKMTNWPVLGRLNRMLNGQDTTPGGVTISSSIILAADATTTNPATLVTFGQLSRQAISGAADGSETVKGIYELATGAEAAAGTSLGSTGARLVIPSSLASSTSSGSYTSVMTDSAGKVSATFGGSASTLATLDSNSLVVQDPANATSTPTAGKIVLGDSQAKVNNWVSGETQYFTTAQAIDTTTTSIPVYFNEDTGLVAKTSASTASQTLFAFIGFAVKGQNIATSSQINVQISGVVSGFTGLTTSSRYYLANSAGTISVTTGTQTYSIGTALSSTTLRIEKGSKRASGALAFTASLNSTTTVGFRVSSVRISMAGTSFLSKGTPFSNGGWTINGGNSSRYYGQDTSPSGVGDFTANAWFYRDGNNSHTGNVTSITNSGFTLSNVKASAPADIIVYWEVEGD